MNEYGEGINRWSMWNFTEDLKKGEEMEETVISILNLNWFNLMKNPDKKWIDLLIIEEWIEVKLDWYAEFSWNFYIEFECNGKPSWILKDEKVKLKYWVHSDSKKLYILKWDEFKSWVELKISDCRANKSLTSKWFRLIESWGNWWRSKGLLVPVSEMEKQAEIIYNI